MVKRAIKALNERNGSSLPDITKYIAANYPYDVTDPMNARLINRALMAGLQDGTYIKVKGSFKLVAKD